MTMFVHLAPEKLAATIRRDGIKPHRYRTWPAPGVYAMPVVRNFVISHQWLRELKGRGQRTIVGVYFRIPDDEVVLVGHYREHHDSFTADRAAALIMEADDPEGLEVVVSRKILADEIHRIRRLPQVLGWRYMPKAHGKRPCGCPVCLGRGTIKSRRLRENYEKSNQ